MIPLCMRLQNFMSYGENGATLDFNAFRIACLCGDNGHGKSALLEAITWAIWGRTRAKSEDDLVQLGKTDMEVELHFALGDERYSVLRKRSLRQSGRRRIATPMLEVQIFDGEGYRPLTGDSVGATQAVLLDLLKMDYETFINSAYIVQGRADEFTIKPAAERKKLLADLLGLDRFARLEERARDASRRAGSDRQQILGAIAEIDAELARRPQYQAELEATTTQIALAEERARAADAELQRWRAELRTVEQRTVQVEELRRRQEQDERECATLRTHLETEEREVLRLEELVAHGPQVRAAAARLSELRTRDEALSGRAQQLLELSAEQRRLEGLIAAARERLVAELELARAKAAQLREQAGQVEVLAEQVARTEAELARLGELERQRDAHRTSLQCAELEVKALEETNERLLAEMKELKRKIDMLDQAGATCPLCQGRLTADGRLALEAELEAEGKRKAEEYRRNLARAKELQAGGGTAEKAIGELELQLGQRPALEARAGALRQAREQAGTAAVEVTAASERETALTRTVDERAFVRDEHAALAELLTRIGRLGYDRAEHEQVRAAAAELRSCEALVAEVAAAEGGLETARRRCEHAAALLATRIEALRAIQEQLAALEEDAAAAAELEARVADASAAVDAAIEESRAANRTLGVAQQRLDHCRYLEEQRVERVAAAIKAADEKTIYDELAVAFGKKGIQALIIDSAIPEIEQEANELLSRLTNGQLTLTFETQREAKSGDNVIETLDIRIADMYGTRDYELYSGGEAFRVNFAIRIALSKLLARRAGTQLQLLVIDEGFGTQDATGRERLVEAINTVASDFEKILVVTHIQELKDAFPVRIDVLKDAEGSKIVATSVLDG